MIVAPQYNPWILHRVNLLLDAIFWFVVALIVELAVIYVNKPKAKNKRRA
jgi:hypothetical protein